jgi:hypothetical protein
MVRGKKGLESIGVPVSKDNDEFFRPVILACTTSEGMKRLK